MSVAACMTKYGHNVNTGSMSDTLVETIHILSFNEVTALGYEITC